MNQNKATIFAFTAKSEGSYSNDPRDAGNWTGGAVGSGTCIGSNYGISASILVKDNPNITANDVRVLPTSKFNLVADSYWKAVMGDQLPTGIDLMLFDYGYNAGTGRSVMNLQKIIGSKPDGIIGKATLAALTSYLNNKGTLLQKVAGNTAAPNTTVTLINALHDQQCDDYKAMKDFPTYGRGWIARTDRRRDLALKLITPQSVPVA